MILAAGVGSRLKPHTDACPKALLEISGKPMLEIVLRRLMNAGVHGVIINVHHMADKIADFLQQKRFRVNIELSREADLLETGGGLKKAAWFFDDGRPFFLHNVDVLTDLDLGQLYRTHEESRALATLAVRKRESGRQLLFDLGGRLCGRRSEAEGRTDWSKGPVEGAVPLAFDGIQVISPGLLPRMTETGAFPITRTYLRLAGEGARIMAFRSEQGYWQDIGDPEKFEAARDYVRDKGLPK